MNNKYIAVAVISLVCCLLVVCVVSFYLEQRIEELNASFVEVKTELQTIREAVYGKNLPELEQQVKENSTHLAEIQADIWNLQAQDEAFTLRWR